MSENFDFLRNFNNDLHYLACIIEDEIYDSPSAVLTDATTFLEIIIYEIFKKYELTMESIPYFKDKVTVLYQAQLISGELSKNLLKAYRIRNKMHSYNGDAKNHILLNKNRAIHIHKLLFNVAWIYYEENCDNQFKVQKPSYIHPSKLKNQIFTENKIDESKCIICEKDTKLGETFCSECKYKIEKSDNLKTIRKHFGYKDGFKRNDLINMGFEKGYIGSFLQELKNEELIYSVGKLNFIDKENSLKYIKEVENMIAIEKLLSDFKLRNIDLKQVLNHEFFQLGKNNEYPFIGLYHLINKIYYSDFINKLNSELTIEEILKDSKFDLNEWYFNKLTQNNIEFSIFNEKLLDEIFIYKKRELTIDEIKLKLNISDEILNYIKKDNAEIGQLYHQKEDDYIFSLFMKNVSQEKVTKEEALKKVKITQKTLDDLLIKYPVFQERFTKSYTLNRMQRFLKHFDYYNYKFALKKTGLVQEEIADWISKGQKMKKHDNNIFYKFYIDFNDISMRRYIEYRKKNNTRHKAAKKIYYEKTTIENLINENENYRKEYDQILCKNACDFLKKGHTKEELITKLDLTPEWLYTALEKGQDGEELYVKLYYQYSKNAIPSQLNEFLGLIKTKPLKNVLSELNMDERELNSWCEKGKSGDELFVDFYKEFLEFKKEKYIKILIKTNSKQKAMKKSYLTQDELSEHEEELNELIFEKRIKIVIEELEKGNTTKQASKKASIKIKDIYEWLKKGLDGNEDFEEFLEVYKKEYLLPIEKAYKDGIKEGANEKNIIKVMKRHDFLVNDDVKYLKQLNLFPKPEDVVIDLEDDLDMNLDEIMGD